MVSALTTAGAFFCFLWMDFRGFSELGLVTGVGVLLCLLAALVLLPALLVWWPLTGGELRRSPALDRLWGLSRAESLCRRPGVVLGAAAILSVGAAVGAGRVELRTGLVDLLPAGAESLRYLELVVEDPNLSAWINVVTAGDLEELAAQAARASDEPTIARFESAASLLPTDPVASATAIARLDALLARARITPDPADAAALPAALARLEGALADAADAAFVGGQTTAAAELESARAEVLAGFERVQAATAADHRRWAAADRTTVQRLSLWADYLRRAAGVPAPTVSSLPGSVRDRLVTRSGRLIGYVHPRDTIFEPAALAEFNRASSRVAADAIGFPVLFERMSGRITSGFAEALGLASVLIVVLLLLDLRSPYRVALALLPVVLGTLWLVGLMGATGTTFNLANLIAIPLILGVGIDSGVHLIHRQRIESNEPIAVVLAQTGRAILIASLTTMIGFGSLVLANHRGIASLGLLLLLGVGACMVASLVVLPNLLALLASSRQPSER